MSDEDYPADPVDDPSSGMSFVAPASSGPAGPAKRIRLEEISLQDLLANGQPYLSTCYFLVAEKRSEVKPELPVIFGVFTITGDGPKGDTRFLAPLRDLSLEEIAKLLKLVEFSLNPEGAGGSPYAGKYTLDMECSPLPGKEKGPDNATIDSKHGDSSLRDIGYLLQNFEITITRTGGGSFGPYRLKGEPTNWGHANVELGLPHGPMTLDSVVSLLSLLDWAPVGKDGVGAFLGGKMTVCYTNKSHTG